MGTHLSGKIHNTRKTTPPARHGPFPVQASRPPPRRPLPAAARPHTGPLPARAAVPPPQTQARLSPADPSHPAGRARGLGRRWCIEPPARSAPPSASPSRRARQAAPRRQHAAEPLSQPSAEQPRAADLCRAGPNSAEPRRTPPGRAAERRAGEGRPLLPSTPPPQNGGRGGAVRRCIS